MRARLFAVGVLVLVMTAATPMAPASAESTNKPVVTGLSVSTGSTAGGQPVVITGTGLGSVGSVQFGYAHVSAVDVLTDHRVLAYAPATQAARTVDVTVSTPHGSSAVVRADRFSYVDPMLAEQQSVVAPLPADAQSPSYDEPFDIDCPAPGWCAGVTAYSASSYESSTFQVVSGSSLVAREIPNLGDGTYGPGSGITDVDCPAVRLCIGVGSLATSDGYRPVIAMLSGKHATAISAPDGGGYPGLYSSSLLFVSCGSSTSCLAIGSTVDQNDGAEPLLDSFDGTGWTSIPLPTVGGSPVTGLSRVSCAGPTCLLLATAADGSPVVLYQRGGKWQVEAPTAPAGGVSAGIDAIDCYAPQHCIAAGQYQPADAGTATGGTSGMFDRFDGADVSAVAAPRAASSRAADNLALGAVSCSAGGTCAAIGSSDNAAAPPFVSVLKGDARTTELPLRDVSLQRISCGSGRSCEISGVYNADYHGFTETLSKGVWTATGLPVPPGVSADSADVFGVSCAGTGYCALLGDYFPDQRSFVVAPLDG